MLLDILGVAFAVLIRVKLSKLVVSKSKSSPVAPILDDPTTPIQDPDHLLVPLDVLQKCRKKGCDKGIAKDAKKEAAGIRKGTLAQNPFSPNFEKILRSYLGYVFCGKSNHKRKYLAKANDLEQSEQATQALVQELQRVFYHDILIEEQLLASYFDSQFLSALPVPTRYIARFEGPSLSVEVRESEKLNPVSKPFHKHVFDELSKDECLTGHVYVAWAEVIDPETKAKMGLVKVGYTAAENPEERKAKIEDTCDVKFIKFELLPTPFAKRIEQLIHAELRQRGYQFLFRCGGQKCGAQKHKEWYKLDYEHAHRTCQYWVDWQSKYNVYEAKGKKGETGAMTAEAVKLLHIEGSPLITDSGGRLWNSAAHESGSGASTTASPKPSPRAGIEWSKSTNHRCPSTSFSDVHSPSSPLLSVASIEQDQPLSPATPRASPRSARVVGDTSTVNSRRTSRSPFQEGLLPSSPSSLNMDTPCHAMRGARSPAGDNTNNIDGMYTPTLPPLVSSDLCNSVATGTPELRIGSFPPTPACGPEPEPQEENSSQSARQRFPGRPDSQGVSNSLGGEDSGWTVTFSVQMNRKSANATHTIPGLNAHPADNETVEHSCRNPDLTVTSTIAEETEPPKFLGVKQKRTLTPMVEISRKRGRRSLSETTCLLEDSATHVSASNRHRSVSSVG